MTVLNCGFGRLMEHLRNMDVLTIFVLTHPSGSLPPLQSFHSFRKRSLSTPVVVCWGSVPPKRPEHAVIRKISQGVL